MRIAVITANFGGFDTPKPFPRQSVDCDYFAITEATCPYTFHTIDNRLKAKYYKMLAHLEYDHDILIWVDGNVEIKCHDFVAKITDGMKAISIRNHPSRSTVFEETDFIVSEIQKGNKYLSSRYNANSLVREADRMRRGLEGLYWCGLFARKNNTLVNQAFEEWWMQNILWSNFDQCNFVDQMHKHSVQISPFNFGDFYENDIYKIHKHNYIG